VALDQSVWDAEARQAEAVAQSARLEHERLSRLVAEGILPRRDLEQAAAQLAQAEAALAAATRTERQAMLRSSIAGVVVRMDAVLDGSVDATTTLVEIVDPDALEGLFRVSASDAARMVAGAGVEVTAAGSGGGDLLARGRVRFVSPALDLTTRTVEVRVDLFSTTRTLRIGEALSGQLEVSVHADAVVVPIEAIVPGDDGEQVFVVDGEGAAHARSVVIGGRSATEAEVLEGLQAGEVVVVHGAYGVTDGAHVRVASQP
jgi:membrane fusion protein (multidrug efflux system)